jgi:hypothetical protein
MSLEASVVCIGEAKAGSLIGALAASFRYHLVEMTLADPPARIAAACPAAVVIAAPKAAPDVIAAIVRRLREMDGPYVPVLALSDDPGIVPSVLPVAPDASPARIAARLTSALRIRALHATIQRRAITDRAAVANQLAAGLSPGHENDRPTVLVAGRGGGYPAITMAVAQKAGLIGALSLETAKNALEARDIDGVVIGDGFSGRAIETFLDLLRRDVRFRDLPIVVADSRVGTLDFDGLANADHVRGGPDRVVAHLLPLLHLHAFGDRLRRWARSLDSKGFVDADTGLLTCDAFLRDLTRAVEESDRRLASLSLARFSFSRLDRHTSTDAARIVGRLVRTTDFACQDDDGSIHVAFGDTDLKAAHVVARRIASVLKHTMLVPDPDAPRLNPEVALVTRKPRDTARTLLARVHPPTIAAE